MILGTGIDIVEVQRVADSISRRQGFLEMVFSPEEIRYCRKQAHPEQHFAARFAAKEAFFKALGTGWTNGTAFHEIEIVHNGKGQPQIHLLGETAVTLGSYAISKMHVSLSHQPTMATAVVILES
ncbi:holo-ACP synthase [Flavihumibacter petaseus]|uniref:Holo-[acyl-carrier-protein] synthase n=1 Tax=Flavihumibacter petaseus NBRC 106054 TaxID=1220578 RepID=A0A0E9MWY6_9BACT|nr:holo-ACP synthase [Flavihumibacter petaseus]GAO42099.1 holo-[acyl-carrier-protein] synthase [Flavihumibacter petaseus NBRC 106054]